MGMPVEAALRRKIPIAISLALSAIYFFTIPFHPFPGSAIVKGGSVVALAILTWRARPRLVALALLASSAGDILLDVDPAGLFVAGLCAFLAAHVLYTIAFASAWPSPLLIPRQSTAALALIVVYVAALSTWLAPSLGKMAAPVAVYICVITTMAASSFIARLPIQAPLGAVLFLISDSLLAAAKFKGTFALRDYAVWATYYAAQFCIAYSWITRTRELSRTPAATSEAPRVKRKQAGRP